MDGFNQQTLTPDASAPAVFCKNCGAALPADAAFCGNCGMRYEPPKPPMPAKTKKTILGVVLGVVALALVLTFVLYLLPQYIMPQVNLSSAQSAFENKDYSASVDYYEKSGLENEPENNGQYNYALAMTEMAAGNYVKASWFFKEAGILDANTQIIACGNALIDATNYEDAIKCFEQIAAEDSTAADLKLYCEAMIAYGDKDFPAAIENLNKISGSVSMAADILPQVYYDYGKKLYNDKDYTNASEQFSNAGDYADASSYVDGCKLMQAEALYQEGRLNAAYDAFKALPQDFSFDGVSVAQRLEKLDGLSEFMAICGWWDVTDNYIESRSVYKLTGAWDSWYYDEVFSYQYVEIFCIPKEDGTVTIKGEVSFYRFTNYSSFSALCNASSTSRGFTVSGLTTVPSSVTIDNSTSLEYSGGKFYLEFYVRDDDSYYYNIYSSDVTFGKRKTEY